MNWGRLDVDLLHSESIYPIEPVKCRSDQFSRPVGVDVSTAPHTDSTLLTPPRLSSPTDMLYHLVKFQVGLATHSHPTHQGLFLIHIYPRPFIRSWPVTALVEFVSSLSIRIIVGVSAR
jgi:hypothetical protein